MKRPYRLERVLPADDLNRTPCAGGCQYRVHVCFGPNCSERGSRALYPVLESALREAGLSQDVELLATTCRNRCDEGPSLNVYPGPVFYNRINRDAINDIVEEHLARGSIVDRWLYRPKIDARRRW